MQYTFREKNYLYSMNTFNPEGGPSVMPQSKELSKEASDLLEAQKAFDASLTEDADRKFFDLAPLPAETPAAQLSVAESPAVDSPSSEPPTPFVDIPNPKPFPPESLEDTLTDAEVDFFNSPAGQGVSIEEQAKQAFPGEEGEFFERPVGKGLTLNQEELAPELDAKAGEDDTSTSLAA